jgi:glycosyltransferase involved in cell wall biosynthesis
MLSVCIITYNQEKYIAQTLDGILMQQTNFDVEVVIGEDCSTDNTKNIIVDYAAQYPGKIKLLPRTQNFGVRKNFEQTLLACTGKYIAICEGDDYWTDNNKLQKQVDFLEANDEYKICFHNTAIVYEDTGKTENANKPDQPETTSMIDLIDHWYMMTCSMVFRNEVKVFPSWFTKAFNTDYALQMLIMGNGGKIGYLPDTMAVYRKHSEGESARTWGADPYYWLLFLFKNIDATFNNKYHTQIQKREREIVGILASYYKTKIITSSDGIMTKAKNLVRFCCMKLNMPNFYYSKFLVQKKLTEI